MLDNFKNMKLSISLLLLALIVNSHGTENVSKYRRDTSAQSQQLGNIPPINRIYNDLSHLARIANAISLQAYAVEGTVKMREIGAELLGTGTQEFTTLLETDVAAIKKAILEMFDDKNTVPASVISQMKGKQMALQFLSENVAKEGVFKEAKDVNVKDIVVFVNSIKGNGTWEFCTKERHILPALSVLDEETNDYIPERKGEALAELQYSPDLNECISKAIPFSDMLQNEFFPKIIDLNKIYQLADFMGKFTIKLPLLQTMSDFLGTLKKEFSETTNFRQVLASKQAAHLAKVVKAHNDGTRTHHDPLYTSGLPNGYDDLIKIKADINSQWFFENVAYRNKTNVKIVEKGLELFDQFTVEMKILHDTWKLFISHDTDQISNFITRWEKVEEYEVDSGIEESLGSSASSFQTCLSKASAAHLNFNFTDFLNIHGDLTKIAEIVAKLVNKVKEINGVDEEKLNKFFTDLKTVNLTKDFEFGSDAIKELETYEDFHKYATIVKDAKALEDQLATKVGEINTTAPISDVSKALDDSKLLDVIDCFTNNKYEGVKMTAAIEFLGKARSLTSNSTLATMLTNYLDDLAKVQVERLAVQKMVTAVKKSGNRTTRSTSPMPLLNLPNHAVASQVLGTGLKVLRDIGKTLMKKQKIKDVMKFNTTISADVVSLASATDGQRETEDSAVALAFKDPKTTFGVLVDGLEKLEAFAATTNGSLTSIAEVFERASKIRGFTGKRAAMEAIGTEMMGVYPDEGIAMSDLGALKLDFAKNTLHSTSTTLNAVKGFFDELFGKVVRGGGGTRFITVTEEQFPNWAVATICIGSFVICILSCFIGYGITENGRNKYYDTYLYYFPNMKVFEKRWRYSKFMDTMNGHNALLDACREVNTINEMICLKKGAYVNALSPFGNSALHLATRSGYYEVVKCLIESGADLTLLNSENLTAAEMIPADYRTTLPERIDGFEKIQKLYKTWKKGKYRIRVPPIFKSHLFHIFLHASTEDDLTNRFTEAFRGITSEEALDTTTHCIVKTNEEGILETDDFDIFRWIFLGVIMVKESWMTACLENPKNIRKDHKYLVTSVKFNGVLYENCIPAWSEAVAKGKILYLYGAYLLPTTQISPKSAILNQIVMMLGGVYLPSYPEKEQINMEAHPLHLAHMPPLWIIHDGSMDVKEQAACRNHPDKLFAVLSEDELMGLLLKREVHLCTTKPTLHIFKE